MSVVSRLAKSKVANTSQFLESNSRYLLEVQAIKDAPDTFKGDFAIAQLKVLKAEPKKPGAVPTGVGSICDYMERTDDKENNGGGRFKRFLLNLVGEEDEKKSDDVSWLEKFFNEKQAGTYLLIEAETFDGTIQKGANQGKTITKTKFYTVTPSPEQLKAIDAKRAEAKLPPLSAVL